MRIGESTASTDFPPRRIVNELVFDTTLGTPLLPSKPSHGVRRGYERFHNLKGWELEVRIVSQSSTASPKTPKQWHVPGQQCHWLYASGALPSA